MESITDSEKVHILGDVPLKDLVKALNMLVGPWWYSESKSHE